jgi:hypothetical protein
LNLDKLCERRFTENFVPQNDDADPFAFGAAGVDRGVLNDWNGPDLPIVDGVDIRDKAYKAAIDTLGIQPQNGVPVVDGIRDRPLLERETRIMPKSSDNLRTKPMTTYENTAYFPDNTTGGYKAPTIMPQVNKRVESTFQKDAAFHLPTSGHGGSAPLGDEWYDRDLKNDVVVDDDMFSYGSGLDTSSQSWQYTDLGQHRTTNEKQTYNDLNYSLPSSSVQGAPQRNVRVGPTRKQELSNVPDYVGLDGAQDRGFISVERTTPRLTQKETMHIDGSRIGAIEAPYNHPSYNVDDVAIPGPTNKEYNLMEKVGLPSVGNTDMLPDHPQSLRPTLKDDLSMESAGYIRPGGSLVPNQSIHGKETRRVSALRSYKSQAPLIQDYDSGVRIIGKTNKTRGKVYSNIVLPYIDNDENDLQYPSLEKESQEFATVRKPRRFLDNSVKDTF